MNYIIRNLTSRQICSIFDWLDTKYFDFPPKPVALTEIAFKRHGVIQGLCILKEIIGEHEFKNISEELVRRYNVIVPPIILDELSKLHISKK